MKILNFFPRSLLLILLASMLLRLATAYFNTGYMAVDDNALLKYSVPAQLFQRIEKEADVTLAGKTEIRSSVPEIFVNLIAKTALATGLEDPINQVRAIYAVLGIFSLFGVFIAYRIFMVIGDERKAVIAASLMGMHFAMPFLSTRALIESMAIPFFLLSLFYLIRYHIAEGIGRKWDLSGATGWLTAASMIRFQSGIVLPAIFIIPFIHKKKKDLLFVLFAGLIYFVISGLFDLFLGKGFHGSLIAYLRYNLLYSSNYGVSPVLTYAISIFFLGFIPFLIARYGSMNWREEYRPLLPAILYFSLFIVVHSIIPHKEERFLATILPVLFILITPMIHYFLPIRSTPFRWSGAIALNGILLYFTVFYPAEANNVNFIRFYNDHPTLTRLISFEDSMTDLPMNYTSRTELKGFRYATRFQTPVPLNPDCSEALIVRENLLPVASAYVHFEKYHELIFLTSPLESLLLRLNPSGNVKRSPIHMFVPSRCGGEIKTVIDSSYSNLSSSDHLPERWVDYDAAN